MSLPAECCGRCRFAREAPPQGGLLNVGAGVQLHCWRFPPQIVPTQFGGVTSPPVTSPGDWCGEFQAARPAIAAA
jgi:hypothetical protein